MKDHPAMADERESSKNVEPNAVGNNLPSADEEHAIPRASTYFLAPSPKEMEKKQEREGDNIPPETKANRVDLDDLKNTCFFLFPDRNRRLSRFWLLMVLSTIIATSGVAGDSSATVIGAMSE